MSQSLQEIVYAAIAITAAGSLVSFIVGLLFGTIHRVTHEGKK